MKKNIVILGSNSVLGLKAIEFFQKYPNKFIIVGISYDDTVNNLPVFINQINIINPKIIYTDKHEIEKEILEKTKTNATIYSEEPNFTYFLKATEIDSVISALADVSSVKKILSAIYEYKDITLLNSAPILYSGSIIPKEAESKGVFLNICTYSLYSLDQFLKIRKVKDVNSIYLFTNLKSKELKLNPSDYTEYFDYEKVFNSLNKLRVLYAMYLVNHIYNIPADKFRFYEQSSSLISVLVQFDDGSNLLSSTKKNIDYILNYYFLDTETLKDMIYPNFDDITISFKQVDPKEYEFLTLGVDALKEGGLSPIIFYLTMKTITELMYNKKLKDKVKIINILKEIITNKDYLSKHLNLGSILTLDQKITEEITTKYGK